MPYAVVGVCYEKYVVQECSFGFKSYNWVFLNLYHYSTFWFSLIIRTFQHAMRLLRLCLVKLNLIKNDFFVFCF